MPFAASKPTIAARESVAATFARHRRFLPFLIDMVSKSRVSGNFPDALFATSVVTPTLILT